ncbi:small lysine-rich protein 1 [Cimex lectularius]|uniref:Small lysine-rich protein 1 n=1 Tax=Cimex lectularius TaxID=79782 RepID=A0A8I6SB77_CIMLE|nr:small lysine-rich protein 1 [Cimex lectularius]
MPVKSKKKDKAKNGEKKKKTVKRAAIKTGGRKEGRSKSRCQVDIFNEHAVENAYYTCHNVMDVLKIRGFPWPEAAKKKKKGKKK